MPKTSPHDGPLPDSVTPLGLELRLFGPIEVKVGSQPLPHLRSRKGLWLLALLALREGRNLDRDWIAGTLWPDCDERHGRINLRQTLHDLRIALGSEAWRLASDEPRTLRLELEGAFVDVLEFDAAIKRGGNVSEELAVSLYRGPLMEDCAEEWALESRRQREQAIIGALETLALNAALLGEHGAAVDRLRAALRIDPYREDFLRALMTAMAEDGNSAGALVAYREYRALLGRQLIGEPAAETATLFKRLQDESRTGAKSKPAAKQSSLQRQAAANQRTLPIPLTALIGRDEDVRRVVSLVKDTRLVTLTGTGGVGKTRLAIRVAEELAPDYPHGVVFVDLAPIENPDILPDAVRMALGVPEEKAQQYSLEAVCQYLSTRTTLMLLDNCEHISQAVRSLVEVLLSRCAGLQILATSRQVLGVKGETLWRVSSLAVPKTVSNKLISPADVNHIVAYQESPAVKLFAERARAAETTFEITNRNCLSVARICTRLDGIPLAIELAAARVKGMTVERIAERLNDRFRILLGRPSSRKPIPRHETLRASIDWSYDLLNQQEQMLLLRLKVFVGGWTLEAAEAVCSGEHIQEWEILELLTGLVEKSMVVYLPGEDRYRLLETIRQYLMERSESGEVLKTTAKHLEHFVAFTEAAEPELTGPRQADWMNRLEADHDNIRAALSWSRNERGAEQGLRLISAVWRFWMVRGYIAEGKAHIALAINTTTEPTVNRAKVLNAAGIMAYRQSDYQAARSYYTQSLAIRRALNDRPGIASSLNNLGVITMEQGDFAAAQPLYKECLELCREIGNRWGTATCLQNLGTVAFSQTNYDLGGLLYEECLALHRELGDPAAIASALSKVAFVAEVKRDYGLACSLHSESLEIRRGLNDRPCIGQSLHDLGRSTLALGERDTALALLKESLEVRRELGDRSGTVLCLEGLALAATDEAGSTMVPRLYGAAEALREQIGYPLAPNEAEDYRQSIERARNTMDDAEFTAGWAEGRAMSVDEAITLALNSRT